MTNKPIHFAFFNAMPEIEHGSIWHKDLEGAVNDLLRIVPKIAYTTHVQNLDDFAVYGMNDISSIDYGVIILYPNGVIERKTFSDIAYEYPRVFAQLKAKVEEMQSE